MGKLINDLKCEAVQKAVYAKLYKGHIHVLLTHQFAYRETKRFEKTRSRMVHHAIKGAWGCFPNKRRDGSYWPSAHCLQSA